MTDGRRHADESDRRGRTFVGRTLIVFSIAALFFLAWELRWLLVMLFGSVVVAVIFRSIANPLHRNLRIPGGVAVALAVLAVLAVLGLAGWLFGSEMTAQIRQLLDTLPAAWQSLQERFGGTQIAERAQEMLRGGAESGSGVLSALGGYTMTFIGGITDAVLIIVGGIYLAAQPDLYRSGLLKLVPKGRRPMVADAADASGRALKLWLLGALISMTIVGVLTGVGLWLIGVPSALALGIVAGLFDFVPIIGPIVAAVPAILVAFTVSPEAALWTAGLFLLVQQIEGNVVQPLAQQYTVDLPALLLLFALLGAGMLFGILGVILAAPMAVVLFVMVKRLYVEEGLHTPTDVPGKSK